MADSTPTLHVTPSPEPIRPVAGQPIHEVAPPTVEALSAQLADLQAQVSTLRTDLQTAISAIVKTVVDEIKLESADVAALKQEVTLLQTQLQPLADVPAQIQTLGSGLSNHAAAYRTHTHTIQTYVATGLIGKYGYSVPVLGYFDPSPFEDPGRPVLTKKESLMSDPPPV